MGSVTITLLDKVDIDRSREITSTRLALLKKAVQQDIDAFRVKYSIDEIKKGESIMFKILIDGEDSEAARNYLRLKHGARTLLVDLHKDDVIPRARVDTPGSAGFGLFFDIGLEGKNALYPLFRMREQLVDGKKVPARKIAKLFGFCNGFAYPVIVAEIDENSKIFVELDARAVDEFHAWRRDGLDRVMCHGETKEIIERTLVKAGAKKEHFIIQESGFLDCIITCDAHTEGAGLVGLIGPRMPHVAMAVFNGAGVAKAAK
ncbi:MAG: DUF2110 family protein [Candidatus Sigynarchaeota archaeon]